MNPQSAYGIPHSSGPEAANGGSLPIRVRTLSIDFTNTTDAKPALIALGVRPRVGTESDTAFPEVAMRYPNSTLASSPRAALIPRLAARWQRLAQPVITALAHSLLQATVKAHEPRIRLTRNAQGEAVWQVFDPVTDTRATFGSEREVRVWLEERYYQS